MKERDVVLISKDELGNTVMDMPITNLRNIEPTSDVVGAIGDADELPVYVDGVAKRVKVKNVKDAVGAHSETATVTLYANQWVGDAVPYTYTLSLSGVTATSNQDFLPIRKSDGLTPEMLAALQAADLQDGGQSTGKVTILAYGEKPKINLRMRVILRGNV